MKMKNIYDFAVYIPSIFYLIPILLLGIGVYFLLNIKNPYVEKRISLLLFGIIFSVVGLVSTVLCSIEVVSSYKNIVIPYYNGNYYEIEGQVDNLKTTSFLGNGIDTFTINNVEFEVGNSKPGYQKQAAYGGAITQNGQVVKIKYIHSYDVNYIMSISVPT